jgi:phosphatidylinositol glycan class C protein
MAPPSGPPQSAIASSHLDAPFPPLLRSSTAPIGFGSHRADPSRLAPEDAYASLSPPRRPGAFDHGGNGSGTESRTRRLRRNDTSRSRSRRRKRFQKLLWVKQSCKDSSV